MSVLAVENNNDSISNYFFSMSTYQEVFLALASGVDRLFVGKIDQDREKAKAWFRQLRLHVEKYPKKLKEIERVALTLLDYFPSFRERDEAGVSFLDSLLIDLIEKKFYETDALDILFRLGANFPSSHAKEIRESLQIPESTYYDSMSTYFMSPRLVFHSLIQSDLTKEDDHLFHSRVVRCLYQQLTEEEYETCYTRLFLKIPESPEVAKLSVIEFAEEHYALSLPKGYEPASLEQPQKESPVERVIKRGVSHPLGLYSKLDTLARHQKSFPLILLYECFKDLPRVFEILLKLVVARNVSAAYVSSGKSPSLFKFVCEAKDEVALVALESLDDAGCIHKAIRSGDLAGLKIALNGKISYEIDSEFEAHYGVRVLPFALQFHHEKSAIMQRIKTAGFEMPVPLSAMQIEHGCEGAVKKSREHCLLM